LFVDDGRGTIFFSRTVYRSLACGLPGSGKHTYPYTVIDVSGTIHNGQALRRQGRRTRKINLYDDGYRLRVVATGKGRFSLRVDIARINDHETFTGLQGPGVVRG